MIKKYAVITAACVAYALGYACFLSPNRLAPGGASGLAVALGEFLPFDKGLMILCLNLPLLVAGALVFGRRFFFSTIYATVVSSLFISAASLLPSFFRPLTEDLLTAGLAGGALTAVGMGFIFREGATTGGTDILVRLIQRRVPHLRAGAVFMAVDSCIVALSAVVFGDVDLALYAAVALFVNTRTFDAVLYGTNSARLLLIVSSRPEEIVSQATRTLDMGVTVIEARGGYTGAEKTMLVCAVKKTAFPRMKKLTTTIDPAAFIIVASADEIYGKGFIRP